MGHLLAPFVPAVGSFNGTWACVHMTCLEPFHMQSIRGSAEAAGMVGREGVGDAIRLQIRLIVSHVWVLNTWQIG